MQAREPWRETFEQVEQMPRWVLRVEAIFDGSWAIRPQEVTTAAVGVRLDDCLAQLENVLPTLTPGSRLAKGLGELARVLTHLRPHLLLCYRPSRFTSD